ncbi:S1C family serine protease [Streptomyces olivaceus]|uniref:S1C family serine protease n=1 Tax=Streptomyces olivaceus TaxID=47716 RepID=UPI001CCC04CC|nr:trypsin-like peptidase domain-containing protein [Streptomyces olivaceus]MBZ6137177.1 trypsin-like peptidase domain-containing protein [Streptomyces olivaceus]MBZ6165378.1 trypsin-like peptidase domain-containing protein [Streptomyces olivaceus]
MNEAKPTRTKWWSRPRPSGETTDGDFELERPGPGTGASDEAQGGDFELERPLPPGTPAGVPGGNGAGDAAGARAGDGDGDYELDLPTPRAERTRYAEPAPVTDAGPATGSPSAPDLSPASDAVPASDAAPAPARAPGPAPVADADAGIGEASPSAPAAERPKPLHEPDPYSTPPYGEPGPWAPAPPVQHPAATPAHGTAAVSSPAPAAHAPAAPGPAPQPPPPHGTAPHGAPPVSPPPGALPDPAFADAPPPTLPTSTHPTHQTSPTHSTPPPPASPLTSVPASADAPPPQAEAAPAAEPGGEPAPDPWGRYDPWAVPAAAPLQHDGSDIWTPKERRGRRRRALVGGALLIALVSGGVGGALGTYLERNGGVGTVDLPQAGAESAERAPDTVAGIAARALPSVVTLHVSGSDAAGTGTGFVLDDRGHILTNNHVVEPAGSGGDITVTFNSGDTAEAEVVGRDGGYDLAVVEVKGVNGLTPMPLGNSDNVRVGDPVVAIGAPFDLAGTVTSGIISAKERPITAGGEEVDGSDVSYVDALQTDAPINPGNSGGPLLDAQGRAIGINSAIRSADNGSAESDGGQAGSIGLGFAIPINQGKRVAEELINTGKAAHPVIGVTLDMNYAGDGARVGAKASDGGPAVTSGGPGARAGIKPGDVITAVDGQRVHSGEELIVKTRAQRPGDRLELTLERDGEETKVSLVLGSSDGD